MGVKRREFVKAGTLAVAGLTASAKALYKDGLFPAHADTNAADNQVVTASLADVPVREDEDVLVRMQRELERAMAKPVEERRWIMVIDTRKCVGCDACTIGCVVENKLPPGVVYRPVVKTEHGEFPNVQLHFTPRPCMHCENPPCVPVCPVNATWQRVDGIVAIDYDKCLGCKYCITACPYLARNSDFGHNYPDSAEGADSGDDSPLAGSQVQEWAKRPSHEYSRNWERKGHKSPIGNARKCHFCLHRLEVGQLPMCATTCIGRATYFGDANDAYSLVTELITKNRVQTLLANLGTHPRVYYIF